MYLIVDIIDVVDVVDVVDVIDVVVVAVARRSLTPPRSFDRSQGGTWPPCRLFQRALQGSFPAIRVSVGSRVLVVAGMPWVWWSTEGSRPQFAAEAPCRQEDLQRVLLAQEVYLVGQK